MKTKIIILSILFAVCTLSSSFFPQFYHLFNPVVGGWSEYQMVDNNGLRSKIKISIVEKRKDNFVIEVESRMEKEYGLISYLVSGDPTEDENVLEVKIKASDGPVIKITKEVLQKLLKKENVFKKSSSIGPSAGKIKTLEDENIKVKDKNIRCKRLKLISLDGKEADIWLNENVIPFGVVKLTSNDESLILEDFGNGAKPTLLEDGIPFVLGEGEQK